MCTRKLKWSELLQYRSVLGNPWVLYHNSTFITTLASSPGPFPAFQCCTLNIEKLGMGLVTRLLLPWAQTMWQIYAANPWNGWNRSTIMIESNSMPLANLHTLDTKDIEGSREKEDALELLWLFSHKSRLSVCFALNQCTVEPSTFAL